MTKNTKILNEIQNEANKILTLTQPNNSNAISTSEHLGTNRKSFFIAHSANHFIKQAQERPVAKMLFGEFWHEEEICILFADTNTGKSILAVQIADSISRGLGISPLVLETEPQRVLYFDFELSDKQFEVRYAVKNGNRFTDHFQFSDDFLRAELNPDFEDFNINDEEYLFYAIEQEVINNKSKILIIDNITFLSNQTDKANTALPLMKALKRLKSKNNISILVLAHTPKRDRSNPLTKNDLMGSKMLINFCDSSFAIGESNKGDNWRYLKQIKARNTPIIYGQDNICVAKVSKTFNFLQFEIIDFGFEYEHLIEKNKTSRDEKKVQAQQLKATGMSQREIADELGISVGSVNNYLNK